MIGYPKPAPRKRRAPATPTQTVRRDVIRRDKNRCQWCGLQVDTSSGWYSLQHRRARDMGGTTRPESNQAANLVLVHGTGTTGCHGEIESHPLVATARGFRIGQKEDPTVAPIQIRFPFGNLIWARFDNDGDVHESAARSAA